MREIIGGILGLVALVVLIGGVVAAVRPQPRIGLGTRKAALVAAGAGFVAMAVAGSLLPEPETTRLSSQAASRDTTTTAPSTTTTIAPTTTTAVPPTTTTAPPPVTAAAATPAAPVARMPAVRCGTDLQLAQDMVQEAGVFFSRSVDASGQDRSQVIDSNWTVLRHTPAAGTPIEEGDPVFYVVKDEEFTGC